MPLSEKELIERDANPNLGQLLSVEAKTFLINYDTITS